MLPEVIAVVVAALAAFTSSWAERDISNDRWSLFWAKRAQRRAIKVAGAVHAVVGAMTALGMVALELYPFGEGGWGSIANGIAFAAAGEAVFRAEFKAFPLDRATTGFSLLRALLNRLTHEVEDEAATAVEKFVLEAPDDFLWALAIRMVKWKYGKKPEAPKSIEYDELKSNLDEAGRPLTDEAVRATTSPQYLEDYRSSVQVIVRDLIMRERSRVAGYDDVEELRTKRLGTVSERKHHALLEADQV